MPRKTIGVAAQFGRRRRRAAVAENHHERAGQADHHADDFHRSEPVDQEKYRDHQYEDRPQRGDDRGVDRAGMLDADHQEQFFCDAHQYGCPDEFYDVSFALHPFDRNEKERQQSQDRGDTYRQGRQCVRRHVLRHNHLVKRVIHRPDQIGQDQAEVGLGLILQCVHGWMIDSWGINSQKTRRGIPGKTMRRPEGRRIRFF